MSWQNGNAWLYIIKQDKSQSVKIGISANVDERLKTLQMGNPDKLEWMYAFESTRKIVKEFEQHFHSSLSNYQLHGEWFTLNDEMLEFILESIAWNDDLFSNMKVNYDLFDRLDKQKQMD